MSKIIKTEDEFDQNIIKSIETLLEENEPVYYNKSEAQDSGNNNLEFIKDAQDPLKMINQVIDSNDPIIRSYLYGGTQDYTRWSTIESDEPTEPNYIDPMPYAPRKEDTKFIPAKPPVSIKTPIQPQFVHKQPPLQYQPKTQQQQQPLPSPPILPRNPFAFNLNEKSNLLLNNYLLYNYHLNSNGYFLNAGPLTNNNQYINLENLNYVPGNLYNQINLLNLQDAKQNMKYQRNVQYQQLMQQRLLNQEQDYLKILNYYANVKHQKSMVAPPKAFCAFCKKNGETVYVFF